MQKTGMQYKQPTISRQQVVSREKLLTEKTHERHKGCVSV